MAAVVVGKEVGNYRVVRRIGRGGMGDVYEAEHPILGKRVALKILRREWCDDPELVERFFAEARVVNAIGHENIVPVFDLGRIPDGRYYLTMELLEGESLRARLKREAVLDIALALEIARQAAGALGAAHARGVIHRDIKPDNLFLATKGEEVERVKVLDFGIAKLTSAESAASFRTRTGAVVGTPTYMSPEQCAGVREIDARSDVYALGVVLFQMMTGQTPFAADGLGQIFLKHLREPPPRPSGLRPDLPGDVEDVILRALEKEPADRFQTMLEMRAALETCATSARRVGVGDRALDPHSAPTQVVPVPALAFGTTLSESVGGFPGPPTAPPHLGGAAWLAGGAGVVAVAAAIFAFLPATDRPVHARAPAATKIPAAKSPPVEMDIALPDPDPAPPASVFVDVRSVPTGAEVYVSDRRTPTGRTPFSLRAEIGPLLLTFKKSGFRERTVQLDVKGEDVVDVTLGRAPAPRPARARGIVTDL